MLIPIRNEKKECKSKMKKLKHNNLLWFAEGGGSVYQMGDYHKQNINWIIYYGATAIIIAEVIMTPIQFVCTFLEHMPALKFHMVEQYIVQGSRLIQYCYSGKMAANTSGLQCFIIRFIKWTYLYSLFLLLMVSLCFGLYEDQVGLFDWRQKYIGS